MSKPKKLLSPRSQCLVAETLDTQPELKPDQSGKSTTQIRYNNGLGWNEKTQTWYAHGRAAGNGFTINTGETNHEDAGVFLRNYRLQRIEQHESGEILDLTVREAFQLWERNAPTWHRSRRRPGLQRVVGVGIVYRIWVLPFIGDIEVRKLKPNDIQGVVSRYMTTDGRHGPHAARGERCFIIDLNTPLRWCIKNKFIRRELELPILPNLEDPPVNAVDPSKVIELLETFDRLVGYDLYARIYVRLMALVGLRTANARNIRKESFIEKNTRFRTGITKNGEEATLFVPYDIQALLDRVPGMDKPGYLFPSKDGSRNRGYAWGMAALKRAAEHLGVPFKMAWHRLRATYATSLAKAGAGPHQIMAALMHKSLIMSLRYVKVFNRDVENAQERMMELLHKQRQDKK